MCANSSDAVSSYLCPLTATISALFSTAWPHTFTRTLHTQIHTQSHSITHTSVWVYLMVWVCTRLRLCLWVCLSVCKNVSERALNHRVKNTGSRQAAHLWWQAMNSHKASSKQRQLRKAVFWDGGKIEFTTSATVQPGYLPCTNSSFSEGTIGTHIALILSRPSNSKEKFLNAHEHMTVLALLTELLQPLHLFHFWQPLKPALAEEISTTKAIMTVLSSERTTGLESTWKQDNIFSCCSFEKNWEKLKEKKALETQNSKLRDRNTGQP